MNAEHVCWMREYEITDVQGRATIRMEVSYDDGKGRTPQFFRVPDADFVQARALYAEWGGIRRKGVPRGNTVKGPSVPFSPTTDLWGEIGK